MHSLSELLMKGLLLTRKSQIDPGTNASARAWLMSLTATRERTPAATDLPLLSSPIWLRSHNFDPDYQTLGIGFVACVAALWTGGSSTTGKLFTGSILVNWGSHLTELRIAGDNATNLQKWSRKQRQSRFTQVEQQILNPLVENAIERMYSWVREVADNQDDHTLRQYRTGKGKPRKDFKEIKGKVDAAKKTMMKRLVEEYEDELPTVIRSLYCNPNRPTLHIGLSYHGESLDAKRKCPICETLFKFPMAHGPLAEPQEYWSPSKVGELDYRRWGMPRGCCAEAILFMRAIDDVRATDYLRRELRPNPS